jgi:hypothetical protein
MFGRFGQVILEVDKMVSDNKLSNFLRRDLPEARALCRFIAAFFQAEFG